MSEIDVIKATEQPDDLVFSTPDISQEEYPFVSRYIDDQNWASVMALDLIMQHENDLRDNNNIAVVISDSLSDVIDNTVNDDDLNGLYTESSDRRADIDLEPVDEEIYKKQRDPRLLRNFAYDSIIASGIEHELHDDLITSEPDDSIVNVSDDDVEKNIGGGEAPEDIKSDAEEIAVKLGMEVQHSDLDDKNLIINDVFEVDSTDEYVKKVIGNG